MMETLKQLSGSFISLQGDLAKITFSDLQWRDYSVFVPEVFLTAVSSLTSGDEISLVQVSVNEEKRELVPALVVVLPDFLLDVSSVAECIREYGVHPYYYFINRLQQKSNTAPILLGNAANFFLDAFLHAEDIAKAELKNELQQFFRLYAMELSSCSDLQKRDVEADFFEKLALHFQHIRTIIQDLFPNKNIHRENAVVEPSFVCPSLGLQGRLDFFEQNPAGNNIIIELKSGKTPFLDRNHLSIGLNHQTQAALYQIIVQQVLDIPYAHLQTYICYSKCEESDNPLRLANPSMPLIAQALDIRNQIVLIEKRIVSGELSAASFFAQIVPEKMIHTEELENKLVTNYVLPQIRQFVAPYQAASEIARAYFLAFYSFLTKEQYLSKCGQNENYERSLSALWRMSAKEKQENCVLVNDLQILSSEIIADSTIVDFKMPDSGVMMPDFRVGDAVVLYASASAFDNVTHHQVLKGAILTIDGTWLQLKLRNRQREKTLPLDQRYAMEHDVLDNNFVAQFRGLYAFLSAPQERQDLVLGKMEPRILENKIQTATSHVLPEINALISNVEKAQDLYLLVGPPGTGKTSIALKSLVAHFSAKGNTILLMAYTNRAVDEICLVLNTILPKLKYLRLGSRVNCALEAQEYLLHEQIKDCKKRSDVRHYLENSTIVVGTIAAIAARPELFTVKHFDLAILDEASQVLEPQLLGIWSAKSANGKPAVDKFVLIGDMKQLPAVVSQENGAFSDPVLEKEGIVSGKMSFFERMYRRYNRRPDIVGSLRKQGRMHPDVAAYPNQMFYKGELYPVPLLHQSENWHLKSKDSDPIMQMMASSRVGYLPVASSFPMEEASLVAAMAKCLYILYQYNELPFDAKTTLGIIAPFRSQIAQIKKALYMLEIPELRAVVVDTVERFQGSQRDVILFSFSVHNEKQLRQLTEATAMIDGQLVDRKMNVALTRARKQFFLIGNAYWLDQNPLYHQLKNFLVHGKC